jgi:hypothetical protein
MCACAVCASAAFFSPSMRLASRRDDHSHLATVLHIVFMKIYLKVAVRIRLNRPELSTLA